MIENVQTVVSSNVMKETGVITKIVGSKRYYEITSTTGDVVLLFFEELQGVKFIYGDVLIFDTILTKEFGKCALNPIKTANKFLGELSTCLKTQETVKAYVYNRNEGGYEASYKGLRCFLPNIQCHYKNLSKDLDDLLNTYQIFTVIGIENNIAILSLKHILRSDLERLRDLEYKELKIGFQYLGKVKAIQGYGVFISYEFTEGLLHIANIIEDYDPDMSKVEKIDTDRLIKQVVLKGMEVLVWIEQISENQYSLNWDKNMEPNKEICMQLTEIGVKV